MIGAVRRGVRGEVGRRMVGFSRRRMRRK